MQTAFSGNTDGKFKSGEYEYDINIRFEMLNRQSIDDVRNLMFAIQKGTNKIEPVCRGKWVLDQVCWNVEIFHLL